MKRCGRSFFCQQTAPELARALLGCTLVHQSTTGKVAGLICETEAYTETDEASHTYGGRKTKRNRTMFAAGGHLYIYLTYGLHYCLNIVADKEGVGSAVLIRTIKLTDGLNLARKKRQRDGRKKLTDTELTDGPGKLCQALDINKQYDGLDLTNKHSLIYIQSAATQIKIIKCTPRIGISRGRDTLWRFVAKL